MEKVAEINRKVGVEVNKTNEYNDELLGIIKQTTEITPWNIVKTCEKEGGFEAWRRLHVTYAAKTNKSRRVILKAIILPDKCKDLGDVVDTAARWRSTSKGT